MTYFQSATDCIQLSLCDVTFLCVSLFTAADVPVVRSLHVELCLKPLRPAVVVSLHTTLVTESNSKLERGMYFVMGRVVFERE